MWNSFGRNSGRANWAGSPVLLPKIHLEVEMQAQGCKLVAIKAEMEVGSASELHVGGTPPDDLDPHGRLVGAMARGTTGGGRRMNSSPWPLVG